MIAWLLYTVVVSALLGLAALAGESALSSRGRPVRWVWAVAVVGSLVAPIVAWLRPAEVEPVRAMEASQVILQPATVWLEATTAASSPSWDRVLLVVCVVASVALAVVLLVANVRLVAARRGWGRKQVDGVPVYVSRDVGPAALGFFGGSIVIPEWALGLEERLRRLMLLHEREHVRAGDPRLLWLGLAAVALMPWNPVAWWMLRRLRLAIELDCDARVMRREPDPRGYGALLLEVGRRFSGAGLVAAALAEPQSFLERRLRRLVGPKPQGWARALAGGGAAIALTVLACEAPEPTTVPLEDPVSAARIVEARKALAKAQEALESAQERTLHVAPPADCRVVYMLDGVVAEVAELGSPGKGVIGQLDPSTIRRIDVVKGAVGAALANRLGVSGACALIRIETNHRAPDVTTPPEIELPPPGINAVEIPPEIGPGDVGTRVMPAATSATSDGRFQAFSAGMERPRLRNPEEVSRELARRYPPLLRDAGIGGMVTVLFWIDETGEVRRIELSQPSGHPALDEAAKAVASKMEFEPARAGGAPTPVLVQIPIRFGVD